MAKISDTEWKARRRLNSITGIGCQAQKRLYDRYGSALGVEQAVKSRSVKVEGIGRAKIASLEAACLQSPSGRLRQQQGRKSLPSFEHLIGYPDETYPELLRFISDPPPFFWAKGQQDCLSEPCVAIVGTRRASTYGRRTAQRLAFELASAGICVVSGLAYGIDRAAHEGALDAGGKTIAVLGSGVDEIYPRSHLKLAAQIEESGCVISEFEPTVKPEKTHFPMRNRIISGLSHATIVVEAFEKAGALITASLCVDQKRDLYAVPGRIDDATSAGTNALLEASAAAVLTNPKQIIADFQARGWLQGEKMGASQEDQPAEESRPRTQLESRILTILGSSHKHMDDIERELEFPGGELWAALLHLECDRLIRPVDGGYYERVHLRR